MKYFYSIFFFLMILFVPYSTFAQDDVTLKNNEKLIFEIYGEPVLIYSDYDYGVCQVFFSILGHNIHIRPDSSDKIKISNDKDIIIHCNGEKGIKIERE